MFMHGGPCHFSSFKHLVHSVMEQTKMLTICLYYYLIYNMIINILSLAFVFNTT